MSEGGRFTTIEEPRFSIKARMLLPGQWILANVIAVPETGETAETNLKFQTAAYSRVNAKGVIAPVPTKWLQFSNLILTRRIPVPELVNQPGGALPEERILAFRPSPNAPFLEHEFRRASRSVR